MAKKQKIDGIEELCKLFLTGFVLTGFSFSFGLAIYSVNATDWKGGVAFIISAIGFMGSAGSLYLLKKKKWWIL